MTTPFGVLPTDAAGWPSRCAWAASRSACSTPTMSPTTRREVPSAWPESHRRARAPRARCLEVVTIARVTQPVVEPGARASPTPPAPRYTPQARAFQAGTRRRRRRGPALRAAARVGDQAVPRVGGDRRAAATATCSQRLRPEIDRARALYDERVPAAVSHARRLLRPGTGAHARQRRRVAVGARRDGCPASAARARPASRPSPAGRAWRRRALPASPGRAGPSPARPGPAGRAAPDRASAAAGEALSDYWLVPPPGWRPARADAVERRRATLAHGVRSDRRGARQPRRCRSSGRAALAGTPLAGYATYLTGWPRCGSTAGRRRATRAFTALRRLQPARRTRRGREPPAGRDLPTPSATSPRRSTFYEDAARPASRQRPTTSCCAWCERPAAPATARVRSRPTRRCYYDWPASEAAASAESEMPLGRPRSRSRPARRRFARELARAERLFAARRYAPARDALRAPRRRTRRATPRSWCRCAWPSATYFLRRLSPRPRRPAAVPRSAARRAEAPLLLPHRDARDLGNHDEYVSLTRALVDEFPDSSWAEEALNNLALLPHRRRRGRRRRTRCSGSWSRDSRPADTRRARCGRSGWWAYRRRPVRRGRRRVRTRGRRRSPGPTTGRRISTGRRRPASSAGDTAAADARLSA